MKKTRKTFKGTVLFTTVSVMALLILFLMGTLMLATASNGRAHKSYSSSQASYTARAAIDGFVTAMERQPEVAIAVQQLEGSGSAIYPTVTIGSGGSSSLGRVVRYDDTGAEHLDEIVVENTGRKSYTYYDNKATGTTGAAWHESEVVKITATARVGNEIESVTAYINKVPSDYSETAAPGPQVKGLQVVGNTTTVNGGEIFGGFGAYLDSKSTELKNYKFNNQAIFENSLTFINANFSALTSTYEAHVYKPDDGVTPYSETVVTGNFIHHNNKSITLNYVANSGWTKKDIPYMYIDGAFVEIDGTSASSPFVDDMTGGDSVFNIFCGTFRTEKPDGGIMNAAFESTNIYMMDEYNPDPHEKYDWPGEIKAGGFEKGDNLWGYNASGGALSHWSDSLFDKTDMYAADGHGGNIYCNGNLTMGCVEIDGDVRVRGDFKVNGGTVKIHGDLIVGGTITKNASLVVDGGIYNGAGAAADYDPVYPTYTEVENVPNTGGSSEKFKFDFLKEIPVDDTFKVQLMKWDTDIHLNSEGQKVDPNGNPYAEEVTGAVYYSLKPEILYTSEVSDEITKLNTLIQVVASPEELAFGENSLFAKYLDSFDTSVYVTGDDAAIDPFLILDEATVSYKGKPVNIGTTDVPQYIPSVAERATEDVYFFYPDDNRIMTQAEVDAEKAKLEDEPIFSASSYRVEDPDTGEVIIDECEYSKTYWYEYGGEKRYVFSLDELPIIGHKKSTATDTIYPLSLTGLTVDEIYPKDMRREYIYGKEQIKASTVGGDPDMYMLAADNREDLRFIKNIFEAREALGLDRATGLPKTGSYMGDDEIEELINNAKAGVANPDYSGGDVIDQKFCRISTNLNNGTITVKGTNENDGTVVLLLDNCEIQKDILFERASSDQKLVIIFKGHVKAFGNKIAPATIPDVIQYTDDYGITYLGYENATFNLYNGGVAFGSFKCPNSNLICKTIKYQFKYRAETSPAAGPFAEHKASIVGNAIFKQADTDNNFALLYTQAGNTPSAPGGGKTINTACGKFVVGYYGAS